MAGQQNNLTSTLATSRWGSLWDRATRRLVVPAGSNLPVHRFKRWLDPAGPKIDEGPVLDAVPLVLARRCCRCGANTATLVGVLVDEPDWTFDPEGFVDFDTVAEVHQALRDGAGDGRRRRLRDQLG